LESEFENSPGELFDVGSGGLLEGEKEIDVDK
jgi:hypothetical protein